MDVKYVTFPFKVKSSAIKILTAKPNVNLRFMFEYLLNMELKSEEHKRHYISEISTSIASVPSIDIQKCIAATMTAIDNKLTIELNTVKRYKDQKRFLLSNIFI